MKLWSYDNVYENLKISMSRMYDKEIDKMMKDCGQVIIGLNGGKSGEQEKNE